MELKALTCINMYLLVQRPRLKTDMSVGDVVALTPEPLIDSILPDIFSH